MSENQIGKIEFGPAMTSADMMRIQKEAKRGMELQIPQAADMQKLLTTIAQLEANVAELTAMIRETPSLQLVERNESLTALLREALPYVQYGYDIYSPSKAAERLGKEEAIALTAKIQEAL